MSITWRKVAAVPFTGSGCGFQGVTCLGQERMLATLEEDLNAAETGPVVRNFLSEDNGETWDEIAPLNSLSAISFSRIKVLSRNVLLMGNDNLGGGPGTYEPAQSIIARSADGGATWTSAVSETFFNAIVGSPPRWLIHDVVPVDTTRVVAVGIGGQAPNTWIFLLSNDGGASFTEARMPSVGITILDGHSVASLGGGIVIAGVTSNPLRLLRSTDRGDTWAAVTLPGAGLGTLAVFHVMNLGGGQALAAGSGGLLWHSSDFGASWSSITALPTNAIAGAAVSASQVVVGMDGVNPVTGSTTPFRLSTDGGATFPDAGTMVSPTNASYAIKQLAVADDGAVIAVAQTTAPPFDEIWRGVIDGFSGPGPCATLPTIRNVTTENGCTTTFRARTGVCIDELTDDDIIRGRWQAGDRLIINRVIFSIDWDYLQGVFTKHVVYTFSDSVRKYGLRPAMRIESRGIRSTPTACGAFGVVGCGIAMLDERAFNLGARYADPPAMLNLEIFYRKHTWEPGDIICVTSAFVPNIVTGRRGITDEAFEIINIQQQFAPEGKIILTLLDVEAITLPEEPDRSVAEDEAELARLREQQVYMAELPLRLEEGRAQRRDTALFRRGKTQEGIPPAAAPSRRREVLVSVSRGIFPGVP
jgi:hypothetical protein